MKDHSEQTGREYAADSATAEPPRDRQAFTQPKLTFIEPKLTRQGSLEQVTQSFFGPFSP